MSATSIPQSAEHNPLIPAQAERILLVVAGVFLTINTLALVLRGAAGRDWLPLLIWVICATAGHWWLNRRFPWRDPLLFPLAMFLGGWGIVIIERLAPLFAERQMIWLVVGVVALGIVTAVPQLLRLLRDYRYTLLLIGLALLLATIIFGTNPSGQASAPQLWLGFDTIFFQPSEVLKIILVVFLASYLAEQYPMLRALQTPTGRRNAGLSPRIIGPMLLMWGLSVVVLIWQRDLGTATLFFIVFLLLLYVASGFTWLLVGGALLIVAAGVVAYALFDVVQLRVDIWLNPWIDADNRAFQIVQSLFAFAQGSVFGQGIGGGSPGYIPVVHSDFVFAAIAEEWGLLGVIAMLTSIAVLVARGMRTAARLNRRAYLSLLAAGLSLLIGVQSLLITGGVLKLIPLTGVTLPFMSYGGSSLVANFIIVGLLLRLSTEDVDRGA
ncbi:MAG: FtsW/RodA/SpoVE family cell cycle protein [Anaerolineae bacterium]|nr:FtsW/RodA/SpoVE family cell cycle protein [Anaerolineae bacterium]